MPRRFVLQSITSLLDQAWLSAINLILGLVLIHFATRESYGIYAQLFVAALFVTSMMESFIINPLTTLAPTRTPDSRAALIVDLHRFHGRVSLVLSFITALACAGVISYFDYSHPWSIAGAFAAYVYTNSLREFQRALGFIEHRAEQVFRTDLIYGGVLISGVAILLATQAALQLPRLFLVMAGGNLAALAFAHRAGPSPLLDHADAGLANKTRYRLALQSAWQRARFGLPGATIAWLINYSYLYLAAAWAGVGAAADLSASRLLLMPISLLVVAWQRVARPRMSQQIAAHNYRALHRTLGGSLVTLVILALAYTGILWLALPWLQTTLLGPEYANVQELTLPWAAYFVLYTIHMVGTGWLLSADRYPALLTASIFSLGLMVLSIVVTLPTFGAAGAIYALIVVATFNVVYIWGILYPVTRAQYYKAAQQKWESPR